MADDNDLVMELAADARADAISNLWKRYGSSIMVGCVLIVLGTAAGVYWQHRNAELAADQTSLFMSATHDMEQGEYKKSADAFGRLARLGGPIYPLAVLRQAQALQEQGDDQAVINALQILAEDKKADLLMRSVAALWIIRLADADKQPKVIDRLTELLTAPENPLWALGAESKALWLLKQNKRKEAQAVLKSLSENLEAPAAVAERASAIMRSESLNDTAEAK